MTTVAIADDHKIFCDSLEGLINDFEGFEVVWTAVDGQEAIEKLQAVNKPQILLLDINMPRKTGIDVAEWATEKAPGVNILALTMENDDNSVIKMIRFGVKGYLLKNIGADELKHALECIVKYGCYYTPLVNAQIGKQLYTKKNKDIPELSERENELLQFLCTDLSYSQIAEKMFLSESTVDTYRARLFEKFNVKNRIGLILKANSLGLVKL
jgi:two-component system invasion response regulator UvrY